MDRYRYFDLTTSDPEEMATANDSGSVASEVGQESQWFTIVVTAFLSFLILATLIGNLLVIISVFHHGPLRTVQNFFVVSLAVADLTVAVFVLPLNVAYWSTDRWTYGRQVCQMWLTCDILCCTSSILNLCAIALDRYWAITDPINYSQKRTIRRVTTIILLVWLLSLLISVPPLLGWNDWPEHFTDQTPCTLTQEKLFVVYSASGSFFIPLVIMSVVYAKIFMANRTRLRERRHKLTSLVACNAARDINQARSTICCQPKTNSSEEQDPEEPSPSLNGSQRTRFNRHCPVVVSIGANQQHKVSVITAPDSSGISVYQFIEQKQRISLSKERKAARVLGIIMGVFVVCWLPFFLMYVIIPFCPACTAPSKAVVTLITWMGYVNSSLNPVIYTVFNEDFRKAFQKIICRAFMVTRQ